MSGPVWLFVPGSRPDRFVKALASGADQVIVDLEDAVDEADKDDARSAARGWLRRDPGGPAWVRVNGPGTPWHAEDLAALADCVGLRGVLVPKVEQPDDLSAASARLPDGVGVMPLVESATGLEAAVAIAAAPRVARLAIGTVDLALDLSCAPSSVVIDHARARLVVASRAAGRGAPVDGVTTDVRDPAAARADADRARRDGFSGKLAVHPDQVEEIRRAFAHDAADVAWAHEVAEAVSGSGHGVTTVHGAMVDAPVVERARRILGTDWPQNDGSPG